MNDSINEENVTIPSNQNGEPEENELDVIEPDEENETSEESLMKFFSMIQNSMSDNDDDDDDIGTSMDANDYHNIHDVFPPFSHLHIPKNLELDILRHGCLLIWRPSGS